MMNHWEFLYFLQWNYEIGGVLGVEFKKMGCFEIFINKKCKMTLKNNRKIVSQ